MKKYFYAKGETSNGPFIIDELKAENITEDTLIWYEGLDNWVKAGELDELIPIFTKGVPPPLPNFNKVVELENNKKTYSEIQTTSSPEAYFTDDNGFQVKLTKDKIYLNAIGIEETFALRSINGIGIYDDIEKYNKELLEFDKWKVAKNGRNVVSYILIGIGVILFLGVFSDFLFGFFALFFLGTGLSLLFWDQRKIEEPSLDSYLRLMLSGNERKFKFYKNASTSTKIANFINKVEKTLTAYR